MGREVVMGLGRWAWRGLVAASLLVVAGLAASFAASRGLPGLDGDRSGCHWTDALVPVVACAEGARWAGAREAFLNAWATGLLWSPLFGLSMPWSLWRGEGPPSAILRLPLVLLPGVVSWGAVAVLIRAAWLAVRRRRA